MVRAFVLANNKEHLNMDGCLWYFGGIRWMVVYGTLVEYVHLSMLHTLDILIKKNVLLFLAYYRMNNLYSCCEQMMYTRGNDILMQTFQF